MFERLQRIEQNNSDFKRKDNSLEKKFKQKNHNNPPSPDLKIGDSSFYIYDYKYDDLKLKKHYRIHLQIMCRDILNIFGQIFFNSTYARV